MRTIKHITATPWNFYCAEGHCYKGGWDVVITDEKGRNFDYDHPDVLDAILDHLGVEITYDYEEVKEYLP